jgi:poly-beta-1,6-N-acetyl-D-glucosamine synthase
MVIVTSIMFFYCVLIIVMIIGWHRFVTQKMPPEATEQLFISIVIPVRNEELHIKRLLTNLLLQNYGNYQIILVDDHSTDNTVAIINSFSDPRVHVYTNVGQGKKKAITEGVRRSEGSIVVTTDADCLHSSLWLNCINRHFQQRDLILLLGPVVITQNKSLFSEMQSVEFAGLIGSAAATAALGIPTMCNGANLAYRRKVFEMVRGYEGNEHIASGDDEFLMRKIQNTPNGNIQFAAARGLIVRTEAQPDLRSFFSQRVRWASKWKHNSSAATIMLAVFIVVSQIATIACFINLLTFVSFPAIELLATKVFVELIFLMSVSKFFQIRWNWPAFILLQILYPFYVVFTSLASNFWPYSWKQRKSSDPVL